MEMDKTDIASGSGFPAWWRARGGAMVAACMFPVLAWMVTTLYLGGALGKNTDDYAINLRNMVTGEVPTPFDPWVRYPYFWRPLHILMCFAVGTLWPDADQPVHIAVAVIHGLACVGLWALLRRLTRSRLAPAAGAMVFMVLPLHGEVAFWFCSTCTAIGSALFFATALAAVRFARAERGGWGLLALVALGTFTVCCFYEQSAALSATLPAICLAVAPARQAWRTRLVRAIGVTAAAGAACVGYVALLLVTAPPTARGGAGTFVTLPRVLPRAVELARGVYANLLGGRGREVVVGGLKFAWENLQTPKGLIAGAMLVSAGALWMVWATRRGGRRPVASVEELGISEDGGTPPPRTVWVFIAGLLAFSCGWLPVYVIDPQIVEFRNTYVPLLGVAIMGAAVLDAILSGVERRRAERSGLVRAAFAVVIVAMMAPEIVSLLGSQLYFQRRSSQDMREVMALKELFPNPPPNTVFVPLRTASVPAHTGQPLFDRGRYGVFETPWSAHGEIQWAYHRSDIGSTSQNPWVPPPRAPVDKPGLDGVRWVKGLSKEMTALFPADPEKGLRIPWGNMIPFVTDADGQLRLVRRVDVERADHRDLEIRPPLVHALMEARKDVPTTTFRMIDGDSSERLDLIPLKFWEYGEKAGGKAAEFQEASLWKTPRRATWLAADAGERSVMSIAMPPLDREEYLLLRASIGEYDLNPKRNPVARVQEMVVTMASAPEKELAVLRLDPANVRATKRWLPLVVTLPPRAGPAGDRIIVRMRLTNDPPVRTDLGDHSPIPADVKGAVPPVWVTHGYEQAKVREGAEEKGK